MMVIRMVSSFVIYKTSTDVREGLKGLRWLK